MPEDDAANLGRAGFTGSETGHRAFKTPQLYNLADSPFYGHGASFRSLEAVLAYKNAAIPENHRVAQEDLSPEFVPLGLNPAQLRDIEVFLSEALYDPDLERYVPASLPSGNPFPVNDPDMPNG